MSNKHEQFPPSVPLILSGFRRENLLSCFTSLCESRTMTRADLAAATELSIMTTGKIADAFIVCTPYVVLSVMPRLTQMNPNIYEAALDLGATPMQAMRRVIIPEIRPGMISGFILAFTLSIDDFAVTIFTNGTNGLETLSTFIYADARKGGLTPELRALSTIILVVVLLLLVVVNYRAHRQAKRAEEQAKQLKNYSRR